MYVLLIDGSGQGDRSSKRAVAEFRAVPLFALVLGFFLMPDCNLQLIAHQRDIDVVIRVDPRDLGLDYQSPGLAVFLHAEPGVEVSFQEPTEGLRKVHTGAAENVGHR